MRKNLVNFSIVLGVFFLIMACVCKSDRNGEPSLSDPSGTPEIRSSNTATKDPTSNGDPTAKKKDEGGFKAEHIDGSSSKYSEIHRQVRKGKRFEKGADWL